MAETRARDTADINATVDLKANLASPTFTGVPAAPTAAAGTNTTQIATTAYANTAGGLQLITPTSIANSGGTATLVGSAVSAVGVTSVSLNGVFTTAYDNYKIIVNQIAISVSGFHNFRFRASGTDNSNASYATAIMGLTNTSVARNLVTVNSTLINMVYNVAGDNAALEMVVFNPQEAVKTTAVLNTFGSESSATAFVGSAGGFGFNATTQFDGFTLYPNGGNANYLIRVYGFKD